MTDCHTIDEINAQPEIWRSWAEELSTLATAAHAFVADTNAAQVWFSGAGTSAFVGDILAVGSFGNLRVRSVPTTDFVARPGQYLDTTDTTISVQFGRSGNSSESVAALDLLDAVRPDIHWMPITCNDAGALARRKPVGPGRALPVVLPAATHDKGFAMTSSFTTMLLSGIACFDRSFDPRETLPAIADAAEALLPGLWSMPMPRPDRAVFLGSGEMQGVARECALKVLELTSGRTFAIAESSLGFRHGPKSMVDDQTTIFVLVHPDPHTAQYDGDIADEVRRQFPSARVVTMGAEGADISVNLSGHAKADAALFALLGQVMGVRWSQDLGLNVDNPFADGNLTRVVDSVTIHSYPA